MYFYEYLFNLPRDRKKTFFIKFSWEPEVQSAHICVEHNLLSSFQFCIISQTGQSGQNMRLLCYFLAKKQ